MFSTHLVFAHVENEKISLGFKRESFSCFSRSQAATRIHKDGKFKKFDFVDAAHLFEEDEDASMFGSLFSYLFQGF